MAGSGHSDNDQPGVPVNDEEDEVENVQQQSDDNSDDSVTWGASDFEAVSDVPMAISHRIGGPTH